MQKGALASQYHTYITLDPKLIYTKLIKVKKRKKKKIRNFTQMIKRLYILIFVDVRSKLFFYLGARDYICKLQHLTKPKRTVGKRIEARETPVPNKRARWYFK